MSKVIQNIVLLMEPSDFAYDISLKAGKMFLNRFCIDEDAAFETTGVYYLFKTFDSLTDLMKESVTNQRCRNSWNLDKRIAKGPRKSITFDALVN